jgi:D-alanine-D-alanine ligase
LQILLLWIDPGERNSMLNIGVFFGGKSGEHEVSLVSGTTIMANLNRARFRVSAIGIRKDGSLASPVEARAMLRRELPDVATPEIGIRPAREGRFVEIYGRDSGGAETRFDLFFPVLHGPFGEDGTIQGLLEMSETPLVGCGVLGSSAGMDKEILKQLFRAEGLPVLASVTLAPADWPSGGPGLLRKLADTLGLPLFVKPARLGSSVGISKVSRIEDLSRALDEAFAYDYKVLVETGIPAREIECSVMGNDNIRASLPGEIVPSNEFYDYAAKYLDNRSELKLPAPLEPGQVEAVRGLAVRAFRAIGGEGYARVDFLLDRRDGTLYVNEVNTIPGFTEISMFPKLWGLSGIGLGQLLDELADLALQRAERKRRLKTSYEVAQ